MATRRSSRFTPNVSQQEIDKAIGRVITELTAQDRISLRDANLLASIIKNDTIDITLQARALQGAQQRFLREYVRGVGRAITRGNITTAKQMQKAQADVYAQLLANSLSIVQRTLIQWNTQAERELKYREYAAKLVGKSFRLYIYDTSPVIEAEYTAGRLLLVAQRLKPMAEAAIYDSLADAFIEAWDGVDLDAFPLIYREKILSLIGKFRSERKIQIQGAGVTTWTIYVDFDTLFGDYGELEAGYHYGALVQGDDENNRVTLPYSGQVLKNPTNRRYAYWQAVWAGKPYYGGYPNLAARNTTQAKTRRRAFYSSQVKKKNQEIRDFEASSSSGLGTIGDVQQFKNLHRERDSLIKRGRASLSDDFKPIDTKGQKQETLNARMVAWGDKAPYWLYLDEGQLQFAPRIAPRAVRYRFFNKVRRMITEMSREMINKELRGFYIDPKGKARLAKGFKPDELEFQGISPKTKPGGLLPTNLIKKQQDLGKKAKRSAQEAVQVSGNFGPLQQIEVDTARFNAAIEKSQADEAQFVADMQYLYGPVRPVPSNVAKPLTSKGSDYYNIREDWASIRASTMRQDNLTYKEAYDRILRASNWEMSDLDYFMYSMRFGIGDK